MLLSSVDRCLFYTGLENTVANKAKILGWLTPVSKRIELWLNRELELVSRTEYFNTDAYRREYFPRAIPITSITSVYSDQFGAYDGGESQQTDFYIGTYNDSLVLRVPVYEAPKGLRLIYTGGEATHGTRSVYTMSAGGFTSGRYVLGGTSGAVGIVRSAGPSLTVENLYGIFEVGETLTEYTTIDLATASGVSATLSAVVTRSLAESNPVYARAAEIEVRFMEKHSHDFEAVTTQNEGVQRRATTSDRFAAIGAFYDLQPETKALLEPYRRVIL